MACIHSYSNLGYIMTDASTILSQKISGINDVLKAHDIDCCIEDTGAMIMIDLDDEYTDAGDDLILRGAFFSHAYNCWIAYYD